jgi:UDP-N-acetylmuramyl pentapeptide phosphotransferase/UDP-N-acetylglucosamine-1-phosphate transferase
MNEITPPAIATESHFRPLQAPKIGGWLIVVAICLVFSFIHNLSNLLADMAPIVRRDVWTRLTDPSSPVYHPYWKPVIIYDALAACFYLVMNVVALILFFGKRRLFPKFTVALIPTIFLFTLLGYYLAGLIPAIADKPAYATQGHALIVRFIALHIWIPYFLVSKRVKETFVF